MPKLGKLVQAAQNKLAQGKAKNSKGRSPNNYAAMFAGMRADGTYRAKLDPHSKKSRRAAKKAGK